VPEWIAAEEARAAVDRDRVLQLDSRRLEPLAQSAQIIDQEGRMARGTVLLEFAVRGKEDVELVVAAGVPDAVAAGIRERFGTLNLLETEEILEKAPGLRRARRRDIYLHMVKAENRHAVIIQADKRLITRGRARG